MSSAQPIPASARSSVSPSDVPGDGRAGSARSASALDGLSLAAAAGGVADLPWLAGAGATPSSSWLVSPSVARPGSGAGYASAVSASSTSTARDKAATGPKITGEWSFLTDPSLSVEEKLARFMMAVQKKLDGELTQKMEDYKAKYGEGGTEAKKDEGGGILGTILKVLCPPLAIAGSVVGGVDEFLKDALQVLGGPLLAALATAVGLPMLAPAALALGEGLGAMLTGGSSTAKPKSGSSGTSKTPEKKPDTKTDTKATTKPKAAPKTDPKVPAGEAGSPDERLEMLEIQRLVDKQNQMFTLVSNVMKNMHETTMVAIQNIR
jgi:hypothetical protein